MQCPLTSVPLNSEDIVDLQVAKATNPRPVEATSMAGLLEMAKAEWDSSMLEIHTLKTEL